MRLYKVLFMLYFIHADFSLFCPDVFIAPAIRNPKKKLEVNFAVTRFPLLCPLLNAVENCAAIICAI